MYVHACVQLRVSNNLSHSLEAHRVLTHPAALKSRSPSFLQRQGEDGKGEDRRRRREVQTQDRCHVEEDDTPLNNSASMGVHRVGVGNKGGDSKRGPAVQSMTIWIPRPTRQMNRRRSDEVSKRDRGREEAEGGGGEGGGSEDSGRGFHEIDRGELQFEPKRIFNSGFVAPPARAHLHLILVLCVHFSSMSVSVSVFVDLNVGAVCLWTLLCICMCLMNSYANVYVMHKRSPHAKEMSCMYQSEGYVCTQI